MATEDHLLMTQAFCGDMSGRVAIRSLNGAGPSSARLAHFAVGLAASWLGWYWEPTSNQIASTSPRNSLGCGRADPVRR